MWSKGIRSLSHISAILSGLRSWTFGSVKPAPAAMVYRTQFRIEFRRFPTPPPESLQVKMRLGFHSVFEHRVLKAEECRAGESKISVSEMEDESAGVEMVRGIVEARKEVV